MSRSTRAETLPQGRSSVGHVVPMLPEKGRLEPRCGNAEIPLQIDAPPALVRMNDKHAIHVDHDRLDRHRIIRSNLPLRFEPEAPDRLIDRTRDNSRDSP